MDSIESASDGRRRTRRRTTTEEEEKVWQVLRFAAQKAKPLLKQKNDSDSDGALPDIVFGDDDDDEEEEDEPPASRMKPKKGKR